MNKFDAKMALIDALHKYEAARSLSEFARTEQKDFKMADVPIILQAVASNEALKYIQVELAANWVRHAEDK